MFREHDDRRARRHCGENLAEHSIDVSKRVVDGGGVNVWRVGLTEQQRLAIAPVSVHRVVGYERHVRGEIGMKPAVQIDEDVGSEFEFRSA